LKTIKSLNEKYPGTQFNLNKFALLTKEQFKEKYLSSFKPVRPESASTIPDYSDITIPDSFDWRDNTPPVVTPVKDQGGCGSCWAFSTVANIEGQWALAGNKLTSLSEQNLVDCDHECSVWENEKSCDSGCNGGLPQNAYAYVMKNGGIDTEATYAYDGYDRTCRFKAAGIGAKIYNWSFVSQDEEQIATVLVSQGPLSVAVEADMWQFYFGGVFYLPCGTDLDHAVLVTGYGTETDVFFQTMPYWTVKNSWGPDWGSSGYIYVERGNGKCGINTYVSTSFVK
jgi:cathepsin F